MKERNKIPRFYPSPRNFNLSAVFIQAHRIVTMKSPSNQPTLPDHDPGLEDDTLWTVLDQASRSEPSPAFLQDTLRRARLEPTATPWWKSLFSSLPVRIVSFASAGTAIAALALVLSSPDAPAPETPVSQVEPTAPAEWNELENALAAEVLTEAAEDPTLFSDQEIVALLY